VWLEKDDIIRCLGDLGFTRIATTDVRPDHPGGPAFSLAAIRE
jgi:hypothetical protein